MLDFPHVVDAQLCRPCSTCSSASWISGTRSPRSHGRGQLVLVEDAELHARRGPRRPERFELGQQVLAPLVPPLHPVLDLAAIALRPASRPAPRDCSSAASHSVPIMAAPSYRLPDVADEGAVAHLGEGGAQVIDVGRLVGSDVPTRARPRRLRRRRGRGRTSQSSAHANVWNADTSMKSNPTMRRTIISSARSRSGKRRIASVSRDRSGETGLPRRQMPMRTSIAWCHVLGLGSSNAMSRAANHMCLWPASSSQPASSRACASNRPRPQVVERGARDALDEVTLHVLDCTSGSSTPKPSTVPMRVSACDRRPGNARAEQELRLRDVREHLGPQLDRCVEHLGTEHLAVRLLPCLDCRHPVLGARRDVRAVGGEAAVAAHAAGDEGFRPRCRWPAARPRTRSVGGCSRNQCKR